MEKASMTLQTSARRHSEPGYNNSWVATTTGMVNVNSTTQLDSAGHRCPSALVPGHDDIPIEVEERNGASENIGYEGRIYS